MKKSAQVPAALIVVLAGLSAGGCNRTVRECRDQMGKLLPDSHCINNQPGAYWITRSIRSGGYGGYGGGYGGYGGGSYFGG